MGESNGNGVLKYEERVDSINSLIFDPDLFQSRVDIDPAWVQRYAERLRVSEAPPLTCFDLIDRPGRYHVVAGFHRGYARLKALKATKDPAERERLKMVRFNLYRGTQADALLFSVQDNLGEFHEGRPVDKGDRLNGLKKLLADPAFRDLPHTSLGPLCGLSPITVCRHRARLCRELGVKPPDSVRVQVGKAENGATYHLPVSPFPVKEKITMEWKVDDPRSTAQRWADRIFTILSPSEVAELIGLLQAGLANDGGTP